MKMNQKEERTNGTFKAAEGNSGTLNKQDVIEMLKEMQVETAKCVGFFAGHVTQGWVIQELLGKKITELGGKPYVIKDSKLIIEKED